jgi:hypothetical protein
MRAFPPSEVPVSTLSWIIAVSLAGGVLSVTAAAALSMAVGTHRVSMLISYAIGALLGAAFLEIIPHALEHGDPHKMAATILFGILFFFILEKLVLWRHCHHDHCEAHEAQTPAHDHGRSGLLILVGDTFHNFVDGILIAAAFLQSTELGIVTALAIIAHEIPQEVGDYLILLHSGYSKRRALAVQSPLQSGNTSWRHAGLFCTLRIDGVDSYAARTGSGQHDLRRGRRSDSGLAQTHGASCHRAAGFTYRVWCRFHRRCSCVGWRVTPDKPCAGGVPCFQLIQSMIEQGTNPQRNRVKMPATTLLSVIAISSATQSQPMAMMYMA